MVDGSIAGVGKVETPVELTVRDGHLTDATGPEGATLLELLTKHGPDGTNVAELGIGTNEEATLTGNILEDEKILGTAHVAFGASAAIGGRRPGPRAPRLRDPRADGGNRRQRDRPRRRAARLSRAAAARRSQRLRGARRRPHRRPASAPSPRGATLLDRHSDADHDRTVFTLAAEAAPLREALLGGAELAVETIDMSAYEGLHPAVGALDVCPVVWLDPADRAAARTEAIEVAEQIGGLGVPVFLYGELASRPEHAERAYFRNGGLAELWLRMEGGGLRPDFGPDLPHRTAGVTLVTARPPLAAFNVELDSGDADVARAVAAGLRESGGGLRGVRAIGLALSSGRSQVSTNVHDPFAVPLADGRRAGARARGAARRQAGRGGDRRSRSRPRRSPGIRPTCRSATSTLPAQTIEARSPAAS